MMATHLHLTPRQLEVYRLLRRGLTYRAIGDELGISWRTVAIHTAELRRKTKSPNNVALISRMRARAFRPRSTD